MEIHLSSIEKVFNHIRAVEPVTESNIVDFLLSQDPYAKTIQEAQTIAALTRLVKSGNVELYDDTISQRNFPGSRSCS